jgi:hypothetical protein
MQVGLKLGQDGTAKGFGSDASAIGNKKNSAIGHDKAQVKPEKAPLLWAALGICGVVSGLIYGRCQSLQYSIIQPIFKRELIQQHNQKANGFAR